MTHTAMKCTTWRTRAGLVLPFVLITLVVVLALSAGVQTMAWRATRGARSQWDAQRAEFAADAAMYQALSRWNAESLAQRPIGTAEIRATTDPMGWQTEVTVLRTGTLVAFASATTTRASSRALSDPDRVWRRVMTVVRLVPPRIPVLAAVTILGDAELASATLDGRDRLPVVPTGSDDCGTVRNTASLGAVAVGRTIGANTPIAYGAQTMLLAPSLQSARDQFDTAWSGIVGKATVNTVNSATTLASTVPWRAIVMTSASTVTLTGASSHIGLFAVDGDLAIDGSLRVDGVLVVRGALRVNGGPLIVRGALIVRDANTLGTRLNTATSVQYAPCVVGRALSVVATPQFAPFLIWNSP